MNLQADPDWWKTLFDETYLRTDARTVCNPELTRREIDLICELTQARPDEAILDLCGGHGRHTLELCSRGFSSLTLADYSYPLLRTAAQTIRANNLNIDLLQVDAQKLPYNRPSFDHVFILGNSLGYIHNPSGDRAILGEVFRLLRPGGHVVVDVTDGAAFEQSFTPVAWHEVDDDLVVCRQRHLGSGAVQAREMVVSKKTGLVRDRTYAIRLYDRKGLNQVLEQAGFDQVCIHTASTLKTQAQDVGFMNHRLLGLGRKPL